jgi:very-short-patch-repair endonuclease
MPRKGDIDRRIASLAARQHGMITARQLAAIGLGRSAVSKRARVGRLHRVHQGVYAVGHTAISAEGRWMAAVLASGGGPTRAHSILERWTAVISHRSAAAVWNLLPDGGAVVDVAVPMRSGKRARRGIRAHRCISLAPNDVTLHRGIPVTRPARTLSDLRRDRSRVGISARDIRRATRQAEVIGLPLTDDTKGDRTRSDLERDFLRLCERHRIPPPEVNVRIGPHLVDFVWRDRHVAVEADGYRYHRGREGFRADHRRDLDLRERGYDVLRFSEEQIEREADRVASDVAAALRVGGRGHE